LARSLTIGAGSVTVFGVRRIVVVVIASIAFALAAGTAAAIPRPYQNCRQFNAKYPHGVGRVNAMDAPKGMMAAPVTIFKRSTALYVRAMSYNKRLDEDKDGIACEKH
jgi:hypothetical protein